MFICGHKVHEFMNVSINIQKHKHRQYNICYHFRFIFLISENFAMVLLPVIPSDEQYSNKTAYDYHHHQCCYTTSYVIGWNYIMISVVKCLMDVYQLSWLCLYVTLIKSDSGKCTMDIFCTPTILINFCIPS